MTPKVLFIRADAGSVIGAGHLMRMLALAEAWGAQGGTFIVGGAIAPAFVPRIAALGGRLVARPADTDDGEWTRDVALAEGAAAIVADGYGFGPVFQRAVREARVPFMVVDDNGENGEYLADFVLNVNVHADEAMYRRRAESTRLLLGPRYALIRREMRDGALRAARPSGPVSHCLVTLGGADPLDLTGRLLRHAARPSFGWRVLIGGANPRAEEYRRLLRAGVELVFDTPRFADEALRCQLAFAASGGTLWELALLGVPSVALSVADNQQHLAQRLEVLGAIEYLGDARVVGEVSVWLERLEAVAAGLERRRRLVDCARAIVDGAGAERVVQQLLEVI